MLNAPQARIAIAKLDSLDYLRAGYAIQDSVITILNAEIHNRQLAVEARDTIIAKQSAISADTRAQLRSAESRAKFWKTFSIGTGAAAITAILFGVFK
jgi:hypothetical protein